MRFYCVDDSFGSPLAQMTNFPFQPQEHRRGGGFIIATRLLGARVPDNRGPGEFINPIRRVLLGQAGRGITNPTWRLCYMDVSKYECLSGWARLLTADCASSYGGGLGEITNTCHAADSLDTATSPQSPPNPSGNAMCHWALQPHYAGPPSAA